MAVDPVRRQLLALALLPDMDGFFKGLKPAPDSFSAWFRAVQADEAVKLQALLARGFDPNTLEPERFDTALILAVRNNAQQVFALLLATPAVNLDARSKNGDTALMIAAYQSNLALATALIDKGAEINRPGWTALHYAATAGCDAIVKILLEHAAYIDAESPNKTTPLMMAVHGAHLTTVKLLLDEGADPTVKNEQGLSALDLAKAQQIINILRDAEKAHSGN
jgi:ankyrin repeat protein